MTPNIVEIDVAKIDNEILDLRSQIEALTTELEIRETLKKYIDKITVVGKAASTAVKPLKGKRFNGVSDFILSTLKEGEQDTQTLITQYAEVLHSTYAKVSGNVSNCLSRLKTAKKINNKLKDGGRKAGSLWHLVTNG